VQIQHGWLLKRPEGWELECPLNSGADVSDCNIATVSKPEIYLAGNRINPQRGLRPSCWQLMPVVR